MTPESTSSLTNFLVDMLAPLQETFPKRTVLQDELGRNTRKSNFVGNQVRVPLLFAPKQGTGGVSQTGTVNIARQLDDRAAFITMSRVTHAIELSTDLMRAVQSRDFVYAGDALKLHMDQAEVAMSRVENEMLNGSGNALLATVSSATTNSTTVFIGTTANFYQNYVGRVVDLLIVASGATVSLGRQITAQSATAGTVTVDAAVTATTGSGIFIEGSFGNAVQGIRQAVATSGTFQGVDLAATPQFQSIDGRGTTTAADLSMPILDGAYRRVMAASGKAPDFWIGDPATIDKFGQGLVSQFRWAPKIVRLDTGWEGIDYRGTPLIPEFDSPIGVVTGVNKSALTIYSYTKNGPSWDDTDGNMFRRFTRSLPVEAWLVDYLQLGIHQPNAIVSVGSLNQAA
jgi:hypothetical protein